MTNTAIKERGIVIPTEMVPGVLDGSVTTTRRTNGLKKFNESPDDWVAHHIDGAEWEFKNIKTLADYHIKCPYGQIGDGLWMREAYSRAFRRTDIQNGCIYKADSRELLNPVYGGHTWSQYDKCWRSPRFMPRWASRKDMVITELRVERLWDITEEDCKAEGVWELCSPYLMRAEFQELWDSINAKRGYPCEVNWWVWVIGWTPTAPKSTQNG